MQFSHIGAALMQNGKQCVDNEIQLEDEAVLLQGVELLLEGLAGLWPVSGDLRQREFGIRQCYAAGVDNVEDVDGFTQRRLDWNVLFRKVPIENALDSRKCIVNLVFVLA